jgi:uncharacterized protein (DUF2342 family)
MHVMSGFGPTGDDNPFEGLPFFGDLGRMLGGLGGAGGGLQWDAARQVAMQVASGGESEANIDPIARMDVEQLARVADLHVTQKTGLSTSMTGRGVQVVPVTRMQWVQRSLDAYKPLFESLATSLAAAPPQPEPPDPSGDPFSAMLTQLMGSMAPMMLGLTAGGMIGHLAQRSFGQYDLPIPREPSDELLLVLPTSRSSATTGRSTARTCCCGCASTRSPTTRSSPCPTCAPRSSACSATTPPASGPTRAGSSTSSVPST